MRRRSIVPPFLAALALFAPVFNAVELTPAAASALGPAARAHASAVACKPAVTRVSALTPGRYPEVTIRGTCFGTGGTFEASDSAHFRVIDLGPNGTLSELEAASTGPHGWWNGCSSRIDAVDGNGANGVTCTVSTWTNTSAHLSSVGGYYGYNGEFVVNKGDKVAMQIWNVQTGRARP